MTGLRLHDHGGVHDDPRLSGVSGHHHPGKSLALLSTNWPTDAFRLNVASPEAVYSERRRDSRQRNEAKMHDGSNDGRRFARAWFRTLSSE